MMSETERRKKSQTGCCVHEEVMRESSDQDRR